MCSCGYIQTPKRCNYRICPCCGKIRSFKFYNQFIKYLKKQRIARSIYDNGLRFLTLTIKNQRNLNKNITELYKAFTKLKRRNYFKERVKGGLGTIDVKKGKNGLWNLHIHFIINSKYLDMKSHKKTGKDSKLVKEWKICTNGSGVLYIERVRNHGGALGYILKYLTKGLKELSYKTKAIFFKATFGRRLLFTFGEFYKLKKQQKERVRCPECHGLYQYIAENSEEYRLLFESSSREDPQWFIILKKNEKSRN